MKNRIMLLVIAVFALLSGCGKKPVEVKEWTQFQDEIFKVSFFYPKDWVKELEPTEVAVSSSADAAEKFFDHDPRKTDGVQISVASERDNEKQDYSDYIEEFKSTKAAEGYTVGQIENATIDGLPAKKLTYSGLFPEDVKIKAVYLATLKDSTIYTVQYSAFGDLFESYLNVFDSVLASLRLPKKIVIEKGVNPAIPLAQTERYSDEYLQLEYPANFGPMDVPKKGDVISTVRFMGKLDGSRRDCTIDIDLRPAKGLNLDKVVAQNSKFFNAVSKGETNIGGEKSVFLNYVPPKVANINSRVYFIVKNDKIYRIIMNYYTPMKKDFLPAFEKVVASIRLK